MSRRAEAPAAPGLSRGIATFVSLTGGRLAGDLFAFVFFVVIANAFGEFGAGEYSIAIGLAGFFFIFMDAGLYYYSIQKAEGAKSDGTELGVILFTRFMLAALLTIVLGGAFALADVPFELAALIGMIGVAQFGFALRMGFSVIFVRRGEAHLAGLIEALCKLAGALLGILIVWTGGTLLWAVACQPVTSLLGAAVSWWIVQRRFGGPCFRAVRRRLLPVLRATMPFGLGELPRLIASRIDIIALGVLLGPAAAGAYNAAFRIIFLLQLATHFAGVSILAEGARASSRSDAEIATLYAASLRLCVLLGVPCAAGIWLIAPRLIDLIYGADFADSAGILRLLAIVLLLSIFRTIMGAFVTLSGLQATRAWLEWLAAGITASACFVLIPLLGIDGAAYAAGAYESLLLFLFGRQMWLRGARPRLGVRFAAALAGTVAFLFLATMLPALPLVLEIVACVVTYALVVMGFPAIRRDEGRGIAEAARGVAGLRPSES